MVEAANDKQLQNAFKSHLEETKVHFNRIQHICDTLGVNPTSTKCKAMEGLIKECEGMLKADADAEVKDAGLIACAQRVEHYEISGYGTSVRFATELGYDDIAQQLQTTLNEEYKADQHMDDLAQGRLNRKAKA